jgi:hypothetical protein
VRPPIHPEFSKSRSLHAVTALDSGDNKGSMGGRQLAWYGYDMSELRFPGHRQTLDLQAN